MPCLFAIRGTGRPVAIPHVKPPLRADLAIVTTILRSEMVIGFRRP